MKEFDASYCAPYEGVLVAATHAKANGLNPFRCRVHPNSYMSIQLACSYLHEYIDEENRSYLVLRTPERLLVYTDPKCPVGRAFIECRSPDSEIEVYLAC